MRTRAFLRPEDGLIYRGSGRSREGTASGGALSDSAAIDRLPGPVDSPEPENAFLRTRGEKLQGDGPEWIGQFRREKITHPIYRPPQGTKTPGSRNGAGRSRPLSSVLPDYALLLAENREEQENNRRELDTLENDTSWSHGLNLGRLREEYDRREKRRRKLQERQSRLTQREAELRDGQKQYEANRWMNLTRQQQNARWGRMSEDQRAEVVLQLTDEAQAERDSMMGMAGKLRTQKDIDLANTHLSRVREISAELERLSYLEPSQRPEPVELPENPLTNSILPSGTEELPGGRPTGGVEHFGGNFGLFPDEPQDGDYGTQQEAEDPAWWERFWNTITGGAKRTGSDLLEVLDQYVNITNVTGPLHDEAHRNAADAVSSSLGELSDELAQSGAEDILQAQEGLNQLGKWMVEAGASAAQMGLDTIAGVGNAMGPMVVRSFGAGARDARQKGYAPEDQVALGLAKAGLEYFTERLFGGNPYSDAAAGQTGLVNEAAAFLTEWLAGSDAARQLSSALASAPAEILSEGLEEVVAELFEPLLESFITGTRQERDWQAVLDAGAVGIIMGLFGAGGEAIDSGFGIIQGQNIQQNAAITQEGQIEPIHPEHSTLQEAGPEQETVSIQEEKNMPLPEGQETDIITEAEKSNSVSAPSQSESGNNGSKYGLNDTTHSMERRAERRVTLAEIDDAFMNPLYVSEITFDDKGRPSVRYIGKDVTVCINPETNAIITTWRTGSRKRRQYEK